MNDTNYLQAVRSVPRANYAEFSAMGDSLATVNQYVADVLQSLPSKFSEPANELLGQVSSSAAVTHENTAKPTLQASVAQEPHKASVTVMKRKPPTLGL
jgi:hypothetical protein